jgi:hypothetical protein
MLQPETTIHLSIDMQRLFRVADTVDGARLPKARLPVPAAGG